MHIELEGVWLVKVWLTKKRVVGKISNWQPGPPLQGEEGGGPAKVTNVAKPAPSCSAAHAYAQPYAHAHAHT